MIAKGESPISLRQATLVVDASGRLAGVITRGDIMRTLMEGTAGTKTVLEAAGTVLEVAYPDDTLQSAVGKMLRRDIGRLPVVERGTAARVVGYVGRADILAARTRLHQEEELRERGPLLGGAGRSAVRAP
jgi:predicted transcriptional regulator